MNASAQRTRFQFTPLREGRQSTTRRISSTHAFQFTPLREGRRFSVYHADYRGNFNSRPSARGDIICWVMAWSWKTFQFTPLREGRRAWRMLGLLESHFNSRPSARGDTFPISLRSLYRISIHAPPRGATQYYQRYLMSTDQPKKHCDTRQSRQSVL